MKNTKSLQVSTEIINIIKVPEWNRYVKDTYGVDYDYIKDHVSEDGQAYIEFALSGAKLTHEQSSLISMWMEGKPIRCMSGVLLKDLCYRNIITPGKYMFKNV
jgi:hypothetical protein